MEGLSIHVQLKLLRKNILDKLKRRDLKGEKPKKLLDIPMKTDNNLEKLQKI